MISCKSEKQKQFEADIIGEWNYSRQEALNKIQETEKPPLFFVNLGGFIFEKDGILINKSGYFDIKESDSREKREIIYFGDSTNYRIKNDSLITINPVSKSQENFKIISIIKDTLTLQKDKDYYIKYYRNLYKPNLAETYDKIVISSSGCYGTCSIMYIEFNKKGDVFYFGEKYNLVNGLFKSKITKSQYEALENSFKKSNISKLKTMYSVNVTDLNTITVTFFRNNKIVKTVSDYAGQAPADFIMAYRRAMYNYQRLKLSKYNLIKGLSPKFSVYKGDKYVVMARTEKFSLINEINNGKEVKIKFNPIYKLTFYDEKDFNVENIVLSDGKYFQLNNKIYDIGYNFIIDNRLEERTKPFY